MKKYLFILLFIAGLLPAAAQQATIQFHRQTLNIPVADASYIPVAASNEGIETAYGFFTRKKIESALSALLSYKKEKGLNDWFYYRLLTAFVDQYYSKAEENFKIAALWYLLNRSGFDARIGFMKNALHLVIYSEDKVYETPKLAEGGKTFYSLTHTGSNFEKGIYHARRVMNSSGKPFSYTLHNLPEISAGKLIERNIHFTSEGNLYNIKFKISRDAITLLQDYPRCNLGSAFETALTEEAYTTLLPELRKLITGKSKAEALRLLLSFVRTGFEYKDDYAHLGKEKWMTPEETLFYAYSDCDDRSALFYYLVKELLNLPMIVLDSPDHITIAVQLKDAPTAVKKYGRPIVHNSKQYWLCEPTDLSDNMEIGFIPKEYQNKKMQVIKEYIPLEVSVNKASDILADK